MPFSHRNDFVKKLLEYKNVGCGGSCLNNIGHKVVDKIGFQKNYKFSVAFENTSHPGYCTEKILDAYNSNCIPIYWGSETVNQDFNKNTFINAADFEDYDSLIEYIKKVDNDDDLYRKFFDEPVFSEYWLDIFSDPEEKFFKKLCNKICPDLCN